MSKKCDILEEIYLELKHLRDGGAIFEKNYQEYLNLVIQGEDFIIDIFGENNDYCEELFKIKAELLAIKANSYLQYTNRSINRKFYAHVLEKLVLLFDAVVKHCKRRSKIIETNKDIEIKNYIDRIPDESIKKLPPRLQKTSRTINNLLDEKNYEPIPVMSRKLIHNMIYHALKIILRGDEDFNTLEQCQENLKFSINKIFELGLLSKTNEVGLRNIKYLGDNLAHNMYADVHEAMLTQDVRVIISSIEDINNRLRERRANNNFKAIKIKEKKKSKKDKEFDVLQDNLKKIDEKEFDKLKRSISPGIKIQILNDIFDEINESEMYDLQDFLKKFLPLYDDLKNQNDMLDDLFIKIISIKNLYKSSEITKIISEFCEQNQLYSKFIGFCTISGSERDVRPFIQSFLTIYTSIYSDNPDALSRIFKDLIEKCGDGVYEFLKNYNFSRIARSNTVLEQIKNSLESLSEIYSNNPNKSNRIHNFYEKINLIHKRVS